VTPDKWEKAAQTDFENLVDVENAFAMVQYLEDTQFCTGICNNALFPVANDVVAKTGLPKVPCFSKI